MRSDPTVRADDAFGLTADPATYVPRLADQRRTSRPTLDSSVGRLVRR
jgi:hypothetical protein